jgi:hypothetical protein
VLQRFACVLRRREPYVPVEAAIELVPNRHLQLNLGNKRWGKAQAKIVNIMRIAARMCGPAGMPFKILNVLFRHFIQRQLK